MVHERNQSYEIINTSCSGYIVDTIPRDENRRQHDITVYKRYVLVYNPLSVKTTRRTIAYIRHFLLAMTYGIAVLRG